MSQDPQQMTIRCPRLGSSVTFAYCLGCGQAGGPCFKICDCWWEMFDVVGCLESRLGHEAVVKLARARPAPKVASLIELIAQARKNASGS